MKTTIDPSKEPALPATHEWLIWALLAAVCAAITAIFAKTGLKHIDPDYASLIRTAIVFVLLLGLVVATGKWRSPSQIDGSTWLFLLLSGLATGASWLFYFRAMKLADASRVAPVDKLSVVLVALFAAFFLGERLGPLGWIGIGLITLGALLIGWPKSS